ncbi:hypothetical protein [Novosphingobium sp.]|uniref:hypothetical protein n=1 Tax=Novosphingobium sp. TaxID=1874826 RepID=UPI0025F11AC2|nr:hypothetical protein [Novosphingobium sp.]MCC6926205.1 hypothetical protein [Novosphingobium sp.]
MQLTYSDTAGGQHLHFKPTLLAALLASGVGTYLYSDLSAGGMIQQAQLGQARGAAGFEVGFSSSARAAEPQLRAGAVAAVPPTLPPVLTAATHSGGQPLALPRTSAPAPSVKQPGKADFAAVFAAPLPIPAGSAALQAQSQLPARHDETGTGTSLAIAKPDEAAQTQALAPVAAAAAPVGLKHQELAAEPAATPAPALAAASPPVVTAPVGPAAIAIAPAPVVPSAKLAEANLASKTADNAAASLSAPQMAAQAVKPIAPPKAEFASAKAPLPQAAPRVSTPPAAQPAANSAPPSRIEPAPLRLVPIDFQLAPSARRLPSSASLAPAKRPERTSPLVKPPLSGTAARKSTRLPDRLVGEYIFHQVSVQLNDHSVGAIDVRIGGDASLSIRVGSLLSIVQGELDPSLFAAMNGSAGADQYVSFNQLRAAGIDVRYEPAGNTIVLTAN